MDNIEKTLQKLSLKVSQFAGESHNTYSSRSSSKGFMGKMNTKPLLMYAAPWIAMLIVLFFWKPDFVTKEVEYEDGELHRKINTQKLLLATAVGSHSYRWSYFHVFP